MLRVSFLSVGTQLLTSGADGLVKLWNVRSAECTNTFDAHGDKVGGWARKGLWLLVLLVALRGFFIDAIAGTP